MILFQAWWVWIGFGLILGILEILLPVFILLGFGLGSVLTGLVMLSGIVMTLPQTLFVFAVFSLCAGLLLKKMFGTKYGSAKTFDHDINDEMR
jgi:membrane protein implicated in regulation of membrane protease activity